MRALLLFALCFGSIAHAVVVKSPVAISLVNKVKSGDKPSLTFTARTVVRHAELVLTRKEDNQTFRYAYNEIKVGETATIPFGDGKPGHFRWSGTLTIEPLFGAKYRNTLSFETGTINDLQVAYDGSRLHLAEHWLEFRPSKAVKSASVIVTSEEGNQIGAGSVEYSSNANSGWLRIDWQANDIATKEKIFSLDLRVVDLGGSVTKVQLVPWSVEIAHADVNFASGQSEILSSEQGKLTDAVESMQAVLDKVLKLDPTRDVRLYVAGHTDTVGGSADNRELSLRRAIAIAKFFRDQGILVKQSVAGCGEEMLRVQTSDNVDEPRNRRADYILSVSPPPLRGCTWQTR